jgi:hypothetical protein
VVENKRFVKKSLSPREMKFTGDEPMMHQRITSLGFQVNSKLSYNYQVRQNRALLYSIILLNNSQSTKKLRNMKR